MSSTQFVNFSEQRTAVLAIAVSFSRKEDFELVSRQRLESKSTRQYRYNKRSIRCINESSSSMKVTNDLNVNVEDREITVCSCGEPLTVCKGVDVDDREIIVCSCGEPLIAGHKGQVVFCPDCGNVYRMKNHKGKWKFLLTMKELAEAMN